MTARDEFFVGWAPGLTRGLRRFLAPLAAVLLLALPALGVVIGSAADDPADDAFALVPGQAAAADLPTGQGLRGVLLDGPYPLLHLPADKGHPRGRTLLLSGDGKRGPAFDPVPLRGRLVAAEGFVLRRGTIEMLILDQAPVPVADAPPPMAPVTEALGRWRISGEVCDGKCAAGGMRPGVGIGHRACATLCLDGELPAIFVATRPVAGHAFLLLADAAGRPAWPALRDLVGRRVILEGQVERRGDLLVFRVDVP